MAVTINGTNGITTNTGTLISASTIGVGGTTPAASGAGITFPATQSASSDANTLDDYEEGTWTPTLSLQSGTSTGGSAYGTYVKIGKQVSITVYVNAGTVTSGLLNGIYNLPFTSQSSNDVAVGLLRENANTGFGWEMRVNSNSTTTLIRKSSDNSQVIVTGDTFIGSVTYFV